MGLSLSVTGAGEWAALPVHNELLVMAGCGAGGKKVPIHRAVLRQRGLLKTTQNTLGKSTKTKGPRGIRNKQKTIGN